MIQKYQRFRARRKLIKHYSEQFYRDLLLKDWITECIVGRKQEHRRKELVEMQDKINEEVKFLEWLRKTK